MSGVTAAATAAAAVEEVEAAVIELDLAGPSLGGLASLSAAVATAASADPALVSAALASAHQAHSDAVVDPRCRPRLLLAAVAAGWASPPPVIAGILAGHGIDVTDPATAATWARFVTVLGLGAAPIEAGRDAGAPFNGPDVGDVVDELAAVAASDADDQIQAAVIAAVPACSPLLTFAAVTCPNRAAAGWVDAVLIVPQSLTAAVVAGADGLLGVAAAGWAHLAAPAPVWLLAAGTEPSAELIRAFGELLLGEPPAGCGYLGATGRVPPAGDTARLLGERLELLLENPDAGAVLRRRAAAVDAMAGTFDVRIRVQVDPAGARALRSTVAAHAGSVDDIDELVIGDSGYPFGSLTDIEALLEVTVAAQAAAVAGVTVVEAEAVRDG